MYHLATSTVPFDLFLELNIKFVVGESHWTKYKLTEFQNYPSRQGTPYYEQQWECKGLECVECWT